MSSAAALLPPPPRPPHDPLWQGLGGRAGWRLLPAAAGAATSGVEEDPADGALVLAPLPGSARELGEPAGSLGGLLLPGLMALDDAGTLWLVDRAGRRLLWFDRCACRFAEAPCQGALRLRDPRALVAAPGRLLIADAAPPGRVLVLDPRALALRAVWRPPGPAPFQPTALAMPGGGDLLVADAASGRLLRFAAWGGSRVQAGGIGAPSRLALDAQGRLYAVVPGEPAVTIRDARSGRLLGTARRPAEVAGGFPEPPLPVSRTGAVDLSGQCEGAGWFAPDGTPLPGPPADMAAPGPAFPTQGRALLGPIDSRIADCVWHRVVLRGAALPPQTRLGLAATTAGTALPDAVVAALPEAAWRPVPAGPEALLQGAEGRYLWLRATLSGDGAATPRLGGIEVEYPRISLRRHLPAAFGADPLSAEFADRFLALFDRGFRDIEARLDDQAALFDPRSAPAAAPDMLGFLAGWIGVSLDRRWPEARRRRLLAEAARLFACRGTVPGLRAALLLFLGWDRRVVAPALPSCGPRCGAPSCAPAGAPALPPLLLEHHSLRRWLFLGAGRLGDAAELWGERILGRSQLDATAQAGVTRLDAVQDPLRDPFHRDAHRFSVFVPARSVATPRDRGALQRLLAEQQPAGTEARIVAVHPRMRIGIQASLGFDTVVGCWPAAGVTVGEARLGRASLLPAAAGPPPLPPRLGRDSRLRSGPPAAAPPDATPPGAAPGEATP